MKICAIGDPHGDLAKVRKMPLKGIDLILLTGDLGSANLKRKMVFDNVERKRRGLPEIEYSPEEEKKAFMEAYDSTINIIKYLARIAPIYTIYGNVESSNAKTRKYSKEIKLKLPFLTNDLNKIKNVRIINNQIANFEGVRIGGLEYFVDTSWVLNFKPSDFEDRLRKAKEQTDKAKKVLRNFRNIDILLCHQPPYGILDRVGKMAPKSWRGKHAGSKTILEYVKKKQPKYVFCGHIHEREGHKQIGKSEVYNLGACGYKMVNL